ncbi:DEAD/DEAH box helicase [Paenibacillus pasadenensis]|uniref:RNA helicase n=1 Tax=Paenibacillus pasadenensis TaxID=217090 RepID=A0A2N5N434_9BACL|nr:DEAD/DEAH box helicase [Paenibacillus pasadenensis]PLT45116.1 ATP-dependent RNA helicase YfmL [Paenibacillus pasadenensis]
MTYESWSRLGLSEAAFERFEANGIGEPTPIQQQAIPPLLAGKDLSAGSQTGTGKTLAYLLPLLQRIDASSKAIQAIILSPTQELAMQIVRVAQEYGEPLGIRTQQLIGGAAVKRQLEKLKLNPQLVVGTPGRINELVKGKKLKLTQASMVVVDEADQVFALGSTGEVETILWATPKSRQLSFFSATHPDVMKTLEKRWMKEPLRIDIEPEQRVSETISHYYVVCDWRDKTDTARRLLRLLEPESALVFINNTDLIANYEAKLAFEGFDVESIYGDADKQKRAATLARFREGRTKLLLATDVAARGLDIPGLPLVVNLEPPADADQYVHRSGRTGRMGREGVVLTLAAPNETYLIEKYERKLGIKLQEKTLYKGKLWDPHEVPRSRSGGAPARAKGAGSASAAAPERRAGASVAGGASETDTRKAAPARKAAETPPAAPARQDAGRGPAAGAARPAGDGAARLSRAVPPSSFAKPASKVQPSSFVKPTLPAKPAGAAKAASASKPAKSKARTAKADKNKGAPKWLKAKRGQDEAPKS